MSIAANSLSLLLRLLEAREIHFAHRSIVEYHGAAGQALIDAGLVVPSGHLRSIAAAEEDDAPLMDIELDVARGELGYHSPVRGWIKVEKSHLQCYRPDLVRIFQLLLGEQLRVPARGLTDLEGALLYDIGTMRLTRRGPLSEVWYARRLGDGAVVERVRAAIARRPASHLRLLLTTTSHERMIADTLPMMCIVPVGDVLASTGDRIDTEVLKARFEGVPRPVGAALWLSDDGRRLTIHGKTISFHGQVIRAILRILVDAHARGERLTAQDILQRSGSGANSLDQAFGKRWAEISPYLKANGGTWAFEI